VNAGAARLKDHGDVAYSQRSTKGQEEGFMREFNWGVYWAIIAAGVTYLAFVTFYNFIQRVRAIRLAKSPMNFKS
jgi:hypothetical protein